MNIESRLFHSYQPWTAAKSAVNVANGLVAVTLDFGSGAFAGAARWLEIGVRTNAAGAWTFFRLRGP